MYPSDLKLNNSFGILVQSDQFFCNINCASKTRKITRRQETVNEALITFFYYMKKQ